MSIQGSPEWFAERLGKVTASRISDILAKGKGSAEAAGRVNYRAQLVAERLSGNAADSFTSAAMQWGTDTEPFARMAYEAHTGNLVREAGFVSHPQIEWAGASPDGLIDDDGLLEIKCPNTATHIDYFLSDAVPERYKPQMAWQIICTQRKWCDFVSYDPRLPEKYQLHLARYEPEGEYLELLETEVKKFLAEVEEVITQLQRKAA